MIYRCKTCDAQASKEPTTKTGTLGTWRCPKHGPTKVTRGKE